MPEGNEIRRFAEQHAAIFAGKSVHVDSPNGGFADRHRYLLQQNDKNARPDCRAMNFMCGPQVVSYQHEQEYVREQHGPRRTPKHYGQRPTGNRCNRQRDRGDNNESLVLWRIEARAEGEKTSVPKISIPVRGMM